MAKLNCLLIAAPLAGYRKTDTAPAVSLQKIMKTPNREGGRG